MQKRGLSVLPAGQCPTPASAGVCTRSIEDWAPLWAKREGPTFGGAHTPLCRGKNTLKSACWGPPSSLPSSPVCRGEPPTADLGLYKYSGENVSCGTEPEPVALPLPVVAQVRPAHLGLPLSLSWPGPDRALQPAHFSGCTGGTCMTLEGCASQSACSHATHRRATPS